LKTLALIPARGGSKGIPHKNIRQFAGKPLIAWTIEAALACPHIDDVVVTTDDVEIAEISRLWGARVPFMRPPELAQDSSPSIDVVMHALNQLPGYDAVVLLQPTSPLRTVDDLNGLLVFARDQQAHAVVSIAEPAASPYWMYQLTSNRELKKLIETPDITRRQNLPAVYALNGALYFANIEWLKQTQSFLTDETKGYVMTRENSLDIDTPLDWEFAELVMSRQR
jgi:CMP-N-acetylneuraminic acid synthetase